MFAGAAGELRDLAGEPSGGFADQVADAVAFMAGFDQFDEKLHQQRVAGLGGGVGERDQIAHAPHLLRQAHLLQGEFDAGAELSRAAANAIERLVALVDQYVDLPGVVGLAPQPGGHLIMQRQKGRVVLLQSGIDAQQFGIEPAAGDAV